MPESTEGTPNRPIQKPLLTPVYHPEDEAKVTPLIEGLKSQSIAFTETISEFPLEKDNSQNESLKNTSGFLLFLSQNSANSPLIQKILDFASQNVLKIIPVSLEKMELLGTLKDSLKPYEEFQVENDDKFTSRVSEILFGLQTQDTPLKKKLFFSGLIFRLILLGVIILLCLGTAAFYYLQRDLDPTVFISSTLPNPRHLTFNMKRKQLRPAENIPIEISGMKADESLTHIFIGISEVDDLHDEFLNSFQVDLQTIDRPLIQIRSPQKVGKYEIRCYSVTEDGIPTKDELLAVIPFTVKGDAKNAFSISLNKSTYTPGELFEVTINNVPPTMLKDSAGIGIYKTDKEFDLFLSFLVANSSNQIFEIDAPQEPGFYELRAYSNNTVLVDSTLVAKIPFEVIFKE
ncbi:MAG: hypothetical protein LBF22_03300 [Deltaproteobacteria bacterium]|jgi:hypothetical protein|nr:hypothetical protein [Deltaproteobacteria bacterium]